MGLVEEEKPSDEQPAPGLMGVKLPPDLESMIRRLLTEDVEAVKCLIRMGADPYQENSEKRNSPMTT